MNEYTHKAVIVAAMLSNMECHEEVESLCWEDYPTIVDMALTKYAEQGSNIRFCHTMETIIPECVKIYKNGGNT